MSVMDHDPKYAKLREWRIQRGLMVSPLPDPPQPTMPICLSVQDMVASVISGMIVSPAMVERLSRIETLDF